MQVYEAVRHMELVVKEGTHHKYRNNHRLKGSQQLMLELQLGVGV